MSISFIRIGGSTCILSSGLDLPVLSRVAPEKDS